MIQELTHHYERYQQGLRFHQAGDWGKAEMLYQQVLALNPAWPVIHYHLGVVFDQQHRLEQAVRHYKKAIALDPEYAEAIENLGCVYLKQGQADRALALLQQAIALKPHQSSSWNNLGQALYANRHLDSIYVQKSIEAYEQALHLQPDLVIAQINLGALFQEQGDDERAIAWFQKVLEQVPNQVTIHSYCAQLYLRQGHMQQALYHWQQLATLQSHLLQPYCHRVLQGEQAFSLDHYQGCLDDVDDLFPLVKIACAQFLHRLLNKASAAETYQWLQQAYEYLGNLLMQEPRGESQAEACFRQALSISPHQPALLLALGNCLAQQARGDAATMLYTLSQTVRQSSSSTQSQIGTQHVKTKKVEGDRPPLCSLQTHPDSQTHYSNYSVSLGYATTSAWVETTALSSVQYQPIAWNPPGSVPGPQPIAFDTPPPPLSQCGVHCPSCMAGLRQAFSPYQIAENIYQCGLVNSISTDPDPFQTFTVTIPKGRAWVAPHQNDWEICHNLAVITPDRVLLADVSRDYPWRLPGCHHVYRQHHRILKPDLALPPVEFLEGRVAILSGLSGHIYYHWMMDVLPRFGLLQQAGWDWHQIDWFVVNSVQRPFQQETLKRLGIPDHKILESDRHPHVQADELVVPSFPGPFAWPPIGTIQFLRSIFLPDGNALSSSPSQEQPPPYLYISRAQASYRRLLNEAQIIEALKPLGFVPITLETLSVEQQAQLFANAKVIVGPHGAGLANTVFCSPGTQIVELTSPRYIRTYYWIVSHHIGLEHYCIQGEGVECSTLRYLMYQNPLTEDMWIPTATLKSMIILLKRLTGQSSRPKFLNV